MQRALCVAKGATRRVRNLSNVLEPESRDRCDYVTSRARAVLPSIVQQCFFMCHVVTQWRDSPRGLGPLRATHATEKTLQNYLRLQLQKTHGTSTVAQYAKLMMTWSVSRRTSLRSSHPGSPRAMPQEPLPRPGSPCDACLCHPSP